MSTLTATKSCALPDDRDRRRWCGSGGRTSRTTPPRSRRRSACRSCAPSSAPPRSSSPTDRRPAAAMDAAAGCAPAMSSDIASSGITSEHASAWASNRHWKESGSFQNDSGCHWTATTNRDPGTSRPSITPSRAIGPRPRARRRADRPPDGGCCSRRARPGRGCCAAACARAPRRRERATRSLRRVVEIATTPILTGCPGGVFPPSQRLTPAVPDR